MRATGGAANGCVGDRDGLPCQYEIPSVVPPEGMEQGYRSRVEKQAEGGVGRGLGPEGVKRTIQMIQMLQR